MKRFNSSLVLWAGLALLTIMIVVPPSGWGSAQTPAGELAKVEKIEVLNLKNAYRVQITTSRPTTYSVNKLSQPEEIVVSLPETLPDKPAGSLDTIDNDLIGIIKRATIDKNGKPATQIAITLKQDAAYDTTNKERMLFIDIVKAKTPDTAKPSPVATVQQSAVQTTPVAHTQTPTTPHETKQITRDTAVKDLKISASDNGYLISIFTDTAVSKYRPFTLNKPARLAIDFPKTKNAIVNPVYKINNDTINTVRVGSTDDTVRCVIDFKGTSVPRYQIAQKDTALHITIFSPAKPAAQKKDAEKPSAVQLSRTTVQPDTTVSTEFAKTTPQKTAETKPASVAAAAPKADSVKPAQKPAVASPQPENKSIAEPVKLSQQKSSNIKNEKPVKGTAFAATSQEVLQTEQKHSAETAVKKTPASTEPAPTQTAENSAAKTESVKPELNTAPEPVKTLPAKKIDVSEPKPVPDVKYSKPSAEQKKPEKQLLPEPERFTAKELPLSSALSQSSAQKISLDFKDADIKNILRLISDVSGFNIIASDRVSGKITLKLENIPWDEALDIILDTNNLGKIVSGNIIRIDTKESIIKSQTEKINQEALQDLAMESIEVSYVKAKEIEKYIKDLKILTDKRGSINSFEHTNKVTVTDVPDKVIKIKELIREQDVPTRQVSIEARIVQSNPSYTKELGVVWGSFYDTTRQGGAANGGADIAVSGAAGNGSVVNLPAPIGLGSGGGINFGYVTNSLQLDIQLSALEKDEKVKIVSSPKVLSLDNKEARIKQGVALPYLKLSEQGVTSTEFKDAVLELKVTPKITPANTISLHVFVTKNQKSAQTGSGGEPGIDVREVETDLLMANASTVVIGGIYENTKAKIINSVPFFSKLPLLGYFFKNVRNEDQLTELLIFLTVKIVNQMPQAAAQASLQFETK